MALTTKEKIFYQDQADSSLEILNKENLSTKEKIAAQDRLTEALEKLGGDKPEKTMYKRLVSGEFNKLPYKQYFEKLKAACEEEYGTDAQVRKLVGISLYSLIRAYLEQWYDSATDSMMKQAA